MDNLVMKSNDFVATPLIKIIDKKMFIHSAVSVHRSAQCALQNKNI